jgi:predicted acetyltransferase
VPDPGPVVRSTTPRVTEGSADADTVAWTRAMFAAFLGPRLEPEQLARAGAAFEGQRLRGAYVASGTDQDPSPAATLRSWDAELTVPGGAVTADAITGIGVRSTHRRRGLARRLLAEDLAAAVRAGTPAAVLTSTQGSLYERFGFGLATRTRAITVDTRRARFRDPVPRGSIELVDRPDAALALAAAVHGRARRRHPGALGRTPGQWEAVLTGAAPHTALEPDRLRQVAVWRDDGGVAAGYVVHRVEEHWHATGAATLGVVDLQATTPGAYAELWRHLCAQDLVGTVTWAQASVDEPLPWLLDDHRAVHVDGERAMLWLRVLDAPAVLVARRYPVEDAIVLDVADDAGFTAGRWRLDTHDRLAPAVEPTRAEPDVTLPVTSLGSVVLGGVDPRVLARAGRLEEGSPGAAGRLARLLAAPSVPWNGTPF